MIPSTYIITISVAMEWSLESYFVKTKLVQYVKKLVPKNFKYYIYEQCWVLISTITMGQLWKIVKIWIVLKLHFGNKNEYPVT